MEKTDAVRHILRNTNHGAFVKGGGGIAWAPSNVALCKYWGKRDAQLNLPVTSSLSISLGNKGAYTEIKQEGSADSYIVNGIPINPVSNFATRLEKFLDLFRPQGAHYLINVHTNVPIAAGFASSACGFASLVQALNNLYDWRLSKKDLSVLARMGSGSACRSVYEGFVEWERGNEYNGMDSIANRLDYIWPKLRIGALIISTKEKAISSTDAMQHTVNSSPLYDSWPQIVEQDLANIKLALEKKDFELLGETAENNALAMHALMHTSDPSVIYSSGETVAAIARVQQLRQEGIPVYFTQDAGPNLQLLFLSENEQAVLQVFPDLDVVMPFVDSSAERVVLVDEKDVEIGTSEKIAAHAQGKLHRAFSVFIMRERKDKIEVLLQQRSSCKYHSAGLWSNACCGHPRPGEETRSAAERRLYEEMNFSVELQEVGQFHYKASLSEVGLIENELDHVFLGFVDRDDFYPNQDEVRDCRWVDLLKLQNELQQNPQRFTVWLQEALQVLCKSGLIC